MDDPTLISRRQLAFTIVYHYLFPQLTMGLAAIYFVLIYRLSRGKVRIEDDGY